MFFCLCFLSGLAFASLTEFWTDRLFTVCFMAVLLASAIFASKHSKKRFIFLAALYALAGILRYQLSFPVSDEHISKLNGRYTQFTAFVSSEPDIRSDGVRYIVTVSEIHEPRTQKSTPDSKSPEKARGRIYLKTMLYPRYEYGDLLSISCKLQTPEPIETFRYDMYLARYGVFSVCANPKLRQIGSGFGRPFITEILDFKLIVAEKIHKLWQEPYAGFMAGLLYGYRGGLGSLNDLFARTGITHIVAISGYNISIISSILLNICIWSCIPRQKAFWILLVCIIVFLVFAGLSASVLRAGVMGIIVLLAKQLGRTSEVGNLMILAALLMTLHNPFVLIWDAGFQLSFLSTMGLIYLSDRFAAFFTWIPNHFQLRESLASTCSAICATLPLILYQFGRLSVVAPLVNILVLWIIPWIMLIGFLAVFLSFIYLPLASFVAWIGFAGLSYIIFIVKSFAAIPFASIDISVSWWMMIASYTVGIYYCVSSKNKKSLLLGRSQNRSNEFA